MKGLGAPLVGIHTQQQWKNLDTPKFDDLALE